MHGRRVAAWLGAVALRHRARIARAVADTHGGTAKRGRFLHLAAAQRDHEALADVVAAGRGGDALRGLHGHTGDQQVDAAFAQRGFLRGRIKADQFQRHAERLRELSCQRGVEAIRLGRRWRLGRGRARVAPHADDELAAFDGAGEHRAFRQARQRGRREGPGAADARERHGRHQRRACQRQLALSHRGSAPCASAAAAAPAGRARS
jgi:hypothetical protein